MYTHLPRERIFKRRVYVYWRKRIICHLTAKSDYNSLTFSVNATETVKRREKRLGKIAFSIIFHDGNQNETEVVQFMTKLSLVCLT